MHEIYKFGHSLAVFISFFIILLLSLRSSSSFFKSPKRFLFFYFLIFGLFALLHYCLFVEWQVEVVAILYGNLDAFFYLLYPLAYWYVRAALQPKTPFQSKDALHIIPFLIQLLDRLPYLFSTYAHKVGIAELIKMDIHEILNHQIGFFFSNRFHFYAKLLQSSSYVLYSCTIYWRYRPRNSKNFILHCWIPAFLLVQMLFILILSYFFLFLPATNQYSLTYPGESILNIIGIGSYLLLSLSVFYSPEFLYDSYLPSDLDAKLKVPPFELTAEKLDEMEAQLDLYLEANKPFLKTRFSLAQLSASLDIPVHNLNYYFRKRQQSNFLEQRMQWRIRHAKELIDAGKDKVITLEAIGLESGFQSRTTFFVNFKEIIGESPSAYADRKNDSKS